MTITKIAIPSHCGDYDQLLESVYRGYVPCANWCLGKCPKDFSEEQTKKMIAECKIKCRVYQLIQGPTLS